MNSLREKLYLRLLLFSYKSSLGASNWWGLSKCDSMMRIAPEGAFVLRTG